jgi:hypothetical protein
MRSLARPLQHIAARPAAARTMAVARAGDAASALPPASSSTSSRLHDRMVVAGTFDVLHAGHYGLLHTAFAHGKHVEIWVRGDAEPR